MPFRLSAALLCSLVAFAPAATPAAEGALKVVASFSILGDLAREVGGDRITLETLVGPDSDSHAYEPRPADAIALAGADVILINGLHFEGFLDRLIEASGTSARVATLTDGIAVLEGPHGGHPHGEDDRAGLHDGPDDPHAWQAPLNVKVYVENIAAAFCLADAAACDTYKANAEAYKDQLDALDVEIRASLAPVPEDRRIVVVAHDAFRYFGAAYGVTFLAPQGVSTEDEASAAAVADLVRQIRAREVRAIFAESASDPRLIEQIANEAGMSVSGTLYSDALTGADGAAPGYLALMRHNSAAIAAALGE